MSVTKAMIQTLFPNTSNTDNVVSIIDMYRNKFAINTNLRLAMFLAQVREEIGDNFKPLRENLNYHEDVLPRLFKNFTPELAKEYGRNEKDKANPVAIANIAYANKLGNGNTDSDNDGDLDELDDGWKYRGAGVLQITGKSNFYEVQKRIEKYAGKTNVSPDTLEGAILFGMAFWMWKDIYRAADTGNIDKVTAIINKYTTSYTKRKAHFDKIKHLI